jgi:hypothetical protein
MQLLHELPEIMPNINDMLSLCPYIDMEPDPDALCINFHCDNYITTINGTSSQELIDLSTSNAIYGFYGDLSITVFDLIFLIVGYLVLASLERMLKNQGVTPNPTQEKRFKLVMLVTTCLGGLAIILALIVIPTTSVVLGYIQVFDGTQCTSDGDQIIPIYLTQKNTCVKGFEVEGVETWFWVESCGFANCLYLYTYPGCYDYTGYYGLAPDVCSLLNYTGTWLAHQWWEYS